MFIIQRYNTELKLWINCYTIKHYKDALEHKIYMDNDYNAIHRIIKKDLTK